MHPVRRSMFNFIVFQLAWFACVLGGANDLAVAGSLVVAVAVGLHLLVAPRRMPEAVLILLVASIGLLWDSLMVSLGLMSYRAGNFAVGVAPHWIIAMWALFATTLNTSMSWMKGRPLLAGLMGAVGGPMAYLAGQRLGGVDMVDPTLALTAQALGWAVIMPLLTVCAARLNGFDSSSARGASGATPAASVAWGR